MHSAQDIRLFAGAVSCQGLNYCNQYIMSIRFSTVVRLSVKVGKNVISSALDSSPAGSHLSARNHNIPYRNHIRYTMIGKGHWGIRRYPAPEADRHADRQT